MSHSRRRLVAAGAILLAAVLAGSLIALFVPRLQGRRPPERLVLIVVDTLRRDYLSAYGDPLATPNIDALAERGQLFPNAMAAFHHTSPSMAALFTGRTPSFETRDVARPLRSDVTRCGLARFAPDPTQEQCIPPTLPALGELLGEAGYWTIGVASSALLFAPTGFERGFDDWIEVGDRRVERPSPGRGSPWLRNPAESRRWRLVNRAALEAVARRPADRFFLYVHYMDVHDYLFRQVGYYTGVADVDEAVGHLLGKLAALDLLDEAVVILTSDHGERLGERKALRGKGGHGGNPSFQEVLQIPLIIAPPVVGDSSLPLRTQDLHYLIREIAGLTPERTPDLVPGELFVGEHLFRTYLKGNWKSAVRRSDGRHFLFDLSADPDEQRDAARTAPEVVAVHSRRIEELSRTLTAEGPAARRELSEEEREKLEVLGYLEEDP